MAAIDPKARETRQRLEKCWKLDLNWALFPEELKEGCHQISQAICIPPTAVLGGLLTITSFALSPAEVHVPGTEWREPALVWLSINMPTGSSKSSLYQFLQSILTRVRKECGYTSSDPSWIFGDASCEKMGFLMSQNGGRLLGVYDELSTFLTQLNLYRGKGLNLTHELALFLQLYNGHPWSRSTVTGDANFCMESTSLTVGGFSQPAVARSIIEQPGSSEIGLAQRILWLFPKPAYAKFSSLESVNQEFSDKLVALLKLLWTPSKSTNKPKVKVFSFHDSMEFGRYFDEVQAQLETLASMDDLLSGMLSKSKGQVLRVAASLTALFHIKDPVPLLEEDPKEIKDNVIAAAINVVETCCQQAAYIAGRGDIKEDIEIIQASISCSQVGSEDMTVGNQAAAHCLKLPGRKLNLTALLYAKKFRAYGYKTGAQAAFEKLEQDGLGEQDPPIGDKKAKKTIVFIKYPVPEDPEKKIDFLKKLAKYGVSLRQYVNAYNEDEITSPKGGKRALDLSGSTERPEPSSPKTPKVDIRRSPRKSPNKYPQLQE